MFKVFFFFFLFWFLTICNQFDVSLRKMWISICSKSLENHVFVREILQIKETSKDLWCQCHRELYVKSKQASSFICQISDCTLFNRESLQLPAVYCPLSFLMSRRSCHEKSQSEREECLFCVTANILLVTSSHV